MSIIIPPIGESNATAVPKVNELAAVLDRRADTLGGLGRTPKSGSAGDSIAGGDTVHTQYSAPFQARSRFYDADFWLDSRSPANGGQNFAVGGTTTQHLLDVQLPQLKANPPEYLHLSAHQNDGITSRDGALASHNRVKQFILEALGTGKVQTIFWKGVIPYDGIVATDRVYGLHYLNDLNRNFIAGLSGGVEYFDVLDLLKSQDRAKELASEVAWREGMNIDAPHFAPGGALACAPLYAAAYRRHFREHLWPTSSSLPYDNAKNPLGNVFPQGSFYGSGALPTGWSITVPTAGITADTVVVDGERGKKAIDVTLSGTGTKNDLILLTTPATPTTDEGDFCLYIDVEYVNSVGVAGIGGGIYGAGLGAAGGDAAPKLVIPGTTNGRARMRSLYPVRYRGTGNGQQANIAIGVANGVAQSGKLRIHSFKWQRVG